MHVVVNHLELTKPLLPETVTAARGAARRVVAAGGRAFHFVQVDETHVILVLFFDSAEDAERISREVGDPWMNQHLVPLLASPTQRSVGEALISER